LFQLVRIIALGTIYAIMASDETYDIFQFLISAEALIKRNDHACIPRDPNKDSRLGG
jgi:hypothetical protein